MKLYPDKEPSQGWWHWCPACSELHRLPQGWQFNGNLEVSTFSPSFQHTRTQGKERQVAWACHYNVTAGSLFYHDTGNTHAMRGTVAMPDIPEGELEHWGLR